MTKPDLSAEALMARKALAEQATPGPWKQTVILYDDEAGRYYDCVDIAGSMIRLAVYWTGNSKMWGGKSVYEMKDANAVHIADNDPSTVIATIDELLRLREQVEALTNMREIQIQELAVELINEAVSDKAGENLKVISLGATCPHCNMQFSTAVEAIEHDATCPKHPATIRAEHLEKEADWLAENCWKKTGCEYIPTRDERGGMWCDECPHEHDCRKCWRDAARKAVEES